MDLSERIDRWHLKFRQYLFKYSNGFYEVPILVNSPRVMIKCLARIPFTKYDPEKNYFSADNLFLSSELIHLEFDDDVTLLLSRSEFKKNIKFKFLYDKQIPCRHYFLRYQIIAKSNDHLALSNGISYSTNTWLFYKPGASPDNYYFKNTSGTFFTIYFTDEFLKQFLSSLAADEKKGMEHFLASTQEYIMYPDEHKTINYSLFLKTIDSRPKAKDLHLPDFEKTTFDILANLVTSLNEGLVTDDFFLLTNRESLKVMEAEKYLRNYLISDFPGIENIAEKVGLSQTSLKKGFRLIYGSAVYHYYRREKMQMAAERLIKDPGMPIAKLALEMGYENAGKFSAAFKDHTGLAPTEYVKRNAQAIVNL